MIIKFLCGLIIVVNSLQLKLCYGCKLFLLDDLNMKCVEFNPLSDFCYHKKSCKSI